MIDPTQIKDRLHAMGKQIGRFESIAALLRITGKFGTTPYLVGGVLRDAILGRPMNDIDVAVPKDAVEIARMLAVEAGGTFVLLDEKHGCARVVFDDAGTMDITDFREQTIAGDCLARDLTCNALAAPIEDFVEKGADALIDPSGALNDIQKGVIRSYAEQNLIDDPLRILRAYRYAATLGFVITPSTAQMIKQHAMLIKNIPAERVLYELVQIFRSRKAGSVLPGMLQSQTLAALFPFFSQKELSSWVGRASHIERALQRIPPLPGYDAARNDLQDFLLVTMLSASLPGTHITDLIVALRLSQKITGRIMRVGMAMVSIRRLVNDHPLDTDFLYVTTRIAMSLGNDRLAPWLIQAAEYDAEQVFGVLKKAERLTVEKVLPIADETPFVTGAELVKMFDKAPGAWISEALERVFFRRIAGKINDREAAINFIRELVETGSV